jgi:hypothetical protein
MSARDQPFTKQEALRMRNLERVRELRDMLERMKAEREDAIQEQSS